MLHYDPYLVEDACVCKEWRIVARRSQFSVVSPSNRWQRAPSQKKDLTMLSAADRDAIGKSILQHLTSLKGKSDRRFKFADMFTLDMYPARILHKALGKPP